MSHFQVTLVLPLCSYEKDDPGRIAQRAALHSMLQLGGDPPGATSIETAPPPVPEDLIGEVDSLVGDWPC